MKLASIFFPASASIFAFVAKILKTYARTHVVYLFVKGDSTTWACMVS